MTNTEPLYYLCLDMRPKIPVAAADAALAALTAVLFWAMVQFGANLLVWVYLGPLFLALLRCRERQSPAAAGLLIVLAAALAIPSSLYWLGRYVWWLLPFGVAATSVLGFGAYVACDRLFRFAPLRILGPPLALTAASVLLAQKPLDGGWVNLAVFHPLAFPVIGVVGSRGVHFLIVLTNWLAAFGLHRRDRRLLAAAALLLAVPAFTTVASTRAVPAGRPLTVVLVQGHFPQPWAWRFSRSAAILDRYESLTLDALETLDAKPDLVVWPEYAVPGDFFRDRALHDRVADFAKRIGTHLLLGTMTFVDERHTDPKDQRTDTVVLFSPAGEFLDRYDSVRPLPFDPMVAKGRDPRVMRLPQGSFTIGVCYEEFSDSPAYAADADFIVDVVNNNLQDRSPGLGLAALFSRLRAVENGKFLVRAANTGLTQVVDPYGKVVARIAPYQPGFLIATIRI